MTKDPHRYDTYLHIPRPISHHPRMDPYLRAAIFSPFAALTGYEDQITDAQTERCDPREPDTQQVSENNAVLCELKKHDMATVVYFVEDPGTNGAGGFAQGRYVHEKGEILEISPEMKTLCMKIETRTITVLFRNLWKIRKAKD